MLTLTRRWLNTTLVVLLFIVIVVPIHADPQAPQGDKLSAQQRRTFEQYAADTWRSFVDLTYPNGLPADNITMAGERARYTSPTNIGAYIWSTLAARDVQIIKPEEARERIGQTLQTLASMERHEASGQFYNWYDPQTGAKLTIWPPTGDPVYPFLSTVDNG